MSTIFSDAQHVQIKRINIHKVPPRENDEHRIVSAQLHRINSMHSTVTPEVISASNAYIQNTSPSKLDEQLFPTRRNVRILLIVGVIVAVLISIVAIIVVVKFRI